MEIVALNARLRSFGSSDHVMPVIVAMMISLVGMMATTFALITCPPLRSHPVGH